MIFLFLILEKLFSSPNATISDQKLKDMIQGINLTQAFATLKNKLNHTDFRLKHPLNLTKINTPTSTEIRAAEKRPVIQKVNETLHDIKVKKMLNESLWLVPMADTLQNMM